MHLIFTMAGLYSRFENFSLNVPKYLLPYKNKSIFHEIVNAFTSKEIDKMSFIVNKRDSNYFGLLQHQIKNLKIKKYDFIIIEKTNSQIETAYKGIKEISNNDLKIPTAITNIDTIIENRNFKFYKKQMERNDCLIDIFRSSNRGYSFVIFDKDYKVKNIKEKIVISDFASSGLYVFKNLQILLDQLNISIKEKEAYFSQMINRMIQDNHKVICNKIRKSEKTIVLGTPEQYLSEIQK